MTLHHKKLFSVFASFSIGLLCQSVLALSPVPPSGIIPTKRAVDYDWMSIKAWEKQHADDTVIAEYEQVDVLFVGDSITAGWDWQIWQTNFAPLKAANFGIGGDNTGNVLWRLQHGAVGNLQPKLIVLLIGVNNIGGLQESPKQAGDGVTRVVQQLQLAWPNSKILLNAVFPFEQDPKSPNRDKVKQLNKIIGKLGNNKTIFFKNYGPLPKGYQVWADAMTPDIAALLKP
jgi:lysophospholipase L1-like esterase